MKAILHLIVTFNILKWCSGQDFCPPGCFCNRVKSDGLPGYQDGLRVHCVQLESGNFDPRILPNNTVQLDLNGYGLRGIKSNFFSNVKHVEKVDLSSNNIEYIDENAFRYLGKLKTLDISDNQISVLTTDSLHGLTALERLKLSNNLIRTIEIGAFSHMPNIQKIDLSDNPLICDCNIGWMLGHWLEVAGARARCQSPDKLQNTLLKKLKTEDLTCDVPIVPTLDHMSSNSLIDIRLVPKNDQIVFEGDSLRLQCHVGLLTNDILIRWFHNDKLQDHSSVTSITNLGPSKHQPSVGHQSQLYISRLREEDTGNWTCSALVDTGLVQNVTVSVAVISSSVILCPATSTNTSKGVYSWGVTLAGHTASQPCHNVSRDSGARHVMVEYTCHVTGRWGVLNDSSCGHTSDVTDKLYRFAIMNNTDFDQHTLIQSASKLLEFTSGASKFQDGMDLVYLTTVLENFLPYITSSQELASLLVDIAANTMRMSPDIIYQGQLLGHAASRLIATIANISRIVPAFQLHRSSLAVDSFKVSQPLSFAGITCSWYGDTAASAAQPGSRTFHCSESNTSSVASSGSRQMLGYVRLPATLYRQMEMRGRDVNIVKSIMFSAFSNSSLFPQVINKKSQLSYHPYKVISSCVLGSDVLTAEPFNLSEPVYIFLRLSSAYIGANMIPAWWDSRANNGLGSWRPDHCHVMNTRHDSTVFACNRLGYYALLAPSDDVTMINLVSDEDFVSTLARYSLVHSAVYTSTLISILLLCSTVCMFTYLYPKIRITRKLKHALPNFWMSLIFFLVFYALSISVQSARHLCQCVGIMLHYFTLTTCMWLTIVTSVVYRKLVNPSGSGSRYNANPYVAAATDEVYIGDGGHGKYYKKPMGQFYLIGWGVPMIICGITAGASFSQYSDTAATWCFLSLAPAIGAVLIPLVLISIIQLFFLLAIFSFSKNNINVESKLVTSHDVTSSLSTLLVTDSHHSHRSHTRVLTLVTLILALVMTVATLSVTTPVPASFMSVTSQHTIFSVLYSVLISILSLLILTYYCLARQDIVHCKLPLGCGYTVQDETSNLVDLTANKHMVQNNTNTYMMDTTLAATSIKSGYNMVDHGVGGSVLGPSSGGRLKQCNLERDSEDDYHSVNNSQHLSRPLPDHMSESDIKKSMSDIIFGPSSKSKVNNVNIHMGEDNFNKVMWTDVRSDWSMFDNNDRSDWSVLSQQCYYPPPAPVTTQQTSPMELPYPDMVSVMQQIHRRDQQQEQHRSLPRRYDRRQDKRRRPGPSGSSLAYSDIEKTEIYSSSKISEVSTSTAASARSRVSKTK